MTFPPVIPFSGYAGWTFLQRTSPQQRAVFEAVPTSKRDEDYFREKIGSVKTADDLVGDRRLLKVALGAFGLDSDLDNKFFIKKVLEGGTLTAGALANRLADKQYLALSAEFGFGDFGVPSTQLSTFADKLLSKYRDRQFEIAVGTQNSDLRLAMNASRELGTLASRSIGETTKWYSVLGSAPLRQVFQQALGLPSSIAGIDLDQQLGVFQAKAERIFGSNDISQFSDPAKVDKLIRQFLVRSDLVGGLSASARGAGALTLLQTSAQSAGANILALLR